MAEDTPEQPPEQPPPPEEKDSALSPQYTDSGRRIYDRWPLGQYVCNMCERELGVSDFRSNKTTCILCQAQESSDKLARAVAKRKATRRYANKVERGKDLNRRSKAAAKKKRAEVAKERAAKVREAEATVAKQVKIIEQIHDVKLREEANAKQKERLAEAEARKELASRELARRRLLHYVERNVPGYEAGWVHEDICRRLERFMHDVEDRKSPRLMIWVPPRHGKQLPHSTPVLTPSGWRTHGELEVGDEVFGPDGSIRTVVSVSAPSVAEYELEFTNGTRIKAHANHEWTVYQRGNGRVRGWKTVETRYLAGRRVWSGGRAVFQLPPVDALQFPSRVYEMPPYVLGAWLGDGSSIAPLITHGAVDTAVISAVCQYGYTMTSQNVHATTGVRGSRFGKVVGNPSRMATELRSLGVWGDKHIPDAYKRGDITQRLQLLAGLIDTDGHVEPATGRVRVITGSRRLAEDIHEVATTLGFAPYITSQPPKLSSSGIQGTQTVYTIGFQPTQYIPTRMPQKQVLRFAPRRRVGIRAVRRCEPEVGRCIQIDAADGLYLVGKTLIPTHNSEIASTQFPSWVLGHHPDWEFIATSYALDLPLGFSRKIRARVQSPEYSVLFPKTELSKDSQSAESWRTTAGGGFRAAGVGGGITGMGAHILVIDDPVKDQEEADSETVREKVWSWFGSTAYTRLAPGGGVLIIQCMTGDTPVLMADGTERPLSAVRVGDYVATYDEGRLRHARVCQWGSNGDDSILKITTNSGKIVRANGRHPFLVSHKGELEWIQAKDLQPTQQIVAVKDSVVSGQGLFAKWKVATSPSPLAAIVNRTITKLSGLRAIAPLQLIRRLGARRTLSTATVSTLRSTTPCWTSKVVAALFAANFPLPAIPVRTGGTSFASTTATVLERFADYSATTVTSLLGTLKQKLQRARLQITSDFTLDPIVRIEADGVAEVFDVQIEGTENFIANGLVSHNTRWHDDDLSGRIERTMMEGFKEFEVLCVDAEQAKAEARSEEDVAAAARMHYEAYKFRETIDRWHIVKYPAIAVHDEYLNKTSGIIQVNDGTAPHDFTSSSYRLLRKKGRALHPARFPLTLLQKYKRTLQPRHWSALYQQNPVPDEGAFFTSDMFRFRPTLPDWREMTVMCAWDLAVGVRTTNDWTVGVVGALDWEDNLWILDMVRGRWQTHDIARYIHDTHLRYDASVTGIEKGQLELAIMPQLQRIMKEKNQYIALAEGQAALKPITDKVMRARPLQGRMQQGKVLFPSDQPWVDSLRNEFLRFPTGTHDDIVDACSWVARMFMNTQPPTRPRAQSEGLPQGVTSWKDRLRGIMQEPKNFMSR